MKKVILSIGTTLVLASAIFVSCKKDTTTTTTQKTTTSQAMTASAMSLNVDAHGFLIFDSPEEVSQYADFLQSHTLGEVKAEHRKFGFTSLAGSKYDKLDQSSLVTEDQLKDFMLDANGLIQVQGTIFKPTSDNVYLLTMQAAVLNEENLNALIAGSFNADLMNRFALNKDRGEEFNLFETVNGTPIGIGESSTGAQSSLMKFWGTSNTYGPCNPPLGKIQYTKVWNFFICVATTTDGYVPC